MPLIDSLFSDLNHLANITYKIDNLYAKNHIDTFHNLKKLRNLIDKFNDKYEGIHVALAKNYLGIKLKFFIDGKSVQNIFSNDFEDTLILKKNLSHNSVEILYRNELFSDKNSAEVQALATHAKLRNDMNIVAELEFCFNTDDFEDKGLGYKQNNLPHELAY